MPRVAQKQAYRSNPECSSAEEYFRATVYVPIIDSVLADIESRFSIEAFTVCRISSLLPEHIRNQSNDQSLKESISTIYETYAAILADGGFFSRDQLEAETSIWFQKWQNWQGDIPQEMNDVLNSCNSIIYPMVRQLLA